MNKKLDKVVHSFLIYESENIWITASYLAYIILYTFIEKEAT